VQAQSLLQAWSILESNNSVDLLQMEGSMSLIFTLGTFLSCNFTTFKEFPNRVKLIYSLIDFIELSFDHNLEKTNIIINY